MRDDIKITNKFARLFYTKQYLMNVNNNTYFSTAEKVLLHPNLTVSDEQYLVDSFSRKEGQGYIVQLTAMAGMMVTYYKNKRFYSYV